MVLFLQLFLKEAVFDLLTFLFRIIFFAEIIIGVVFWNISLYGFVNYARIVNEQFKLLVFSSGQLK